MIAIKKAMALTAIPLVLAGCVSSAEYAGKEAGFSTVSAKVGGATSNRPSGCKTNSRHWQRPLG